MSKKPEVTVGTVHQATHGSPTKPLLIGDIEIPCFVLENGTRLVTQRGFQRAIGMSTSGGTSGAQRVRRFLESFASNPRRQAESSVAQHLAPSELAERLSTPILFRPPGVGRAAYGYEATLLPDACDVILAARDAGLLQKQQLHIARQAEILVRGFARVGIIALIDEATGYQEDRAEDALQQLLEIYIAKELMPWTKTFPDEFYKEIFRLRGWHWNSIGGKRPKLVGQLTNYLVYDRLPPEVVTELKAKNPPIKPGQRRVKLFQWLTNDFGQPVLKLHLVGVMALMRACPPNWRVFTRLFERAYPIPGALKQEELFPEEAETELLDKD